MVGIGPSSRETVPITAKLSRKFYDKLGDEVANELVEWINQVDATYRLELRELNDLNYGRFEARLEQRIAELRAEIRQGLAEVRGELRHAVADFRADVTAALAGQDARMAAFEARLLRQNFLMWIGTLGTIVALLKL